MPAAWESFDAVQKRTISVLDGVCGALEAGMKASDIESLAAGHLKDAGFTGHFHPPEARIGSALGVRRWLENPALAVGDLVRIDLAPADDDAFGDAGVTLSFGAPEPRTVTRAREAVRATAGFGTPWKTVGELFVFARAWLNTRQLTLEGSSAGHLCLGPTEVMGWPRTAHLATRLRRHQIGLLNPRRLRGIWAIRVPVSDGKIHAAFEEMIYVDPDQRRVLGRDGLEGIGSYPSLGILPRHPPGMKGEPGVTPEPAR
jgi:hypothetical protein